MKSKHGAELTLNTVIVAALAIIVLIVLIVIFLQGTQKGTTTFFDCASRDGDCMTSEDCIALGGKRDPSAKCPDEGDVCCLFGQQQTDAGGMPFHIQERST